MLISINLFSLISIFLLLLIPLYTFVNVSQFLFILGYNMTVFLLLFVIKTFIFCYYTNWLLNSGYIHKGFSVMFC